MPDGSDAQEPLTVMSGWTLAIESSTAHGSAAVFHDGELVASTEATLQDRDSERLMPALAEALASAGVAPGNLDRVVCGAGPGSFTGLRIAAAIGKGISHACSIPLYSVSSLLLVGAEAADRFGEAPYIAVMDAMRDERYVLRTSSSAGETFVSTELQLLPMDRLAIELQTEDLRAVGPDHDHIWPHARAVARCWAAVSGPVDLGTWEPQYGRKAEAQVRWESSHGRALTDA